MAHDGCQPWQTPSSGGRRQRRKVGHEPHNRGLNTKIHLAVEAPGRPLGVIITSDTRADGTPAVESELKAMTGHLGNVRLGADHQSPDYQWWHGQPALDGDLIRLREAVAQATRKAALATMAPTDPPAISAPVSAPSGAVTTRRSE